MKSLCNRLGCLLLALVLLATCGVVQVIPVKAAYENTYVNTGDQRADLIGVALTQVGYREGSNNYTKYGVWFGHSNMAWCGAFISWCANQAGIPTSVLRKNGFASASSFGIPSFTVRDRIPRPGDLFFKNNGNHAGIVYYVEGDYFYTLEGNTYEAPTYEDGVYCRKRSLYGEYYFGSPNYQSDAGHNYVKGVETAHPHKEYYRCSDCGSQYYTGRTGTVDDCKQCMMANCSHSYGKATKTDDTYHKSVCTKCTKEKSEKHTWQDSKILKEATCQAVGSKTQTCSGCGHTRTVEIPKTQDHQYGQWDYVDEEKHIGTCATCGHQEEKSHTTDQWQASNLDHWYTCADCGGRTGIGEHNFPGGCGSACTVCEYVNPDGHRYATLYSQDGQYHWYSCLNCGEKKDREEHSYSASCAETCESCGYTRQTEHSFAQEWTMDISGHWHSCTQCGKQESLISHTPGPEATETRAQSCTECGFEIIPAKSHIHDYAPYEADAFSHWGSCDCGTELPKEPHLWDMEQGVCRICGVTPTVPEKTEIPWMIILPCVGGVALLTTGLLVGVKIRKKRKAKKQQPAGVA